MQRKDRSSPAYRLMRRFCYTLHPDPNGSQEREREHIDKCVVCKVCGHTQTSWLQNGAARTQTQTIDSGNCVGVIIETIKLVSIFMSGATDFRKMLFCASRVRVLDTGQACVTYWFGEVFLLTFRVCLLAVDLFACSSLRCLLDTPSHCKQKNLSCK